MVPAVKVPVKAICAFALSPIGLLFKLQIPSEALSVATCQPAAAPVGTDQPVVGKTQLGGNTPCSLSVIVTVATDVPSVVPTGLLSVTVNVSAPSAMASSIIGTAMTLVAPSPAGQLKVPDVVV